MLKIGDPHVKVGLVAGDGGAVIWPLLININRAKELLLTGDLITGQEAYRIGLANRVLPTEQVAAGRDGTCRKISARTSAGDLMDETRYQSGAAPGDRKRSRRLARTRRYYHRLARPRGGNRVLPGKASAAVRGTLRREQEGDDQKRPPCPDCRGSQ